MILQKWEGHGERFSERGLTACLEKPDLRFVSKISRALTTIPGGGAPQREGGGRPVSGYVTSFAFSHHRIPVTACKQSFEIEGISLTLKGTDAPVLAY